MREIRSSGSVEGVVSNHDPYSDSFGRGSEIWPRIYPIHDFSELALLDVSICSTQRIRAERRRAKNSSRRMYSADASPGGMMLVRSKQ